MREADLFVAISRALIAHCTHRLGLSERWARDASAPWRIVRAPCEDCRALAEAVGLELGSADSAAAHSTAT